MKSKNFLVVFLAIIQSLNVVVTQPTSASSDNANKLATKILDALLSQRYKPLLESLDDPLTIQNVEAAIEVAVQNQKDLIANLIKDATTPAKVLIAEEEVLDTLMGVHVDDYLTTIKKLLEKQKSFNTIFIKLSDSEVYIAGNIKTVSLPYAVDGPKMIQTAFSSREFNWIVNDFGLQNSDRVTITI